MLFVRNNSLFLVFVLLVQVSFAQLKYYAAPLRIPLSVSGNFGELRPDHFHTGLDFRTEHRTGVPVYSTAEGDVSRIVVSPGGYGRSLYIDHSNNTTSVYGHLLKFRADLEEFVKDEQYRRQSFAVDLEIPAGKFKVGRQEQIAWSGNSGSSAGPHLHFEIRDTHKQDALNPLLTKNFNITDKTPPKITAVEFIPMDMRSHVEFSSNKKSMKTILFGNVYKPSPVSMIKGYGEIGVAVKANDFFDNNTSPCGVYSAQMNINGEKVFAWTLDRISFSKNRYLNSHIDYEVFIKNRQRFQKLYCDRGNLLGIYNTDNQRGVVSIDSGKVYIGEIILRDAMGNESRLTFKILGVYAQMPVKESGPDLTFSFDSKNRFSTSDFEIRTPKGAFYEDIIFHYHKSETLPGYFSGIHSIHYNTVPIQKPLQIRIKTEGLPDSLYGKAFIAEIDQLSLKGFVGGTFSDGWMEANIMKFGNYAVVTDTIPPLIVPLSIKNNALTETDKIRFRITDNLSGIKSYEGKIDGRWVLFEYDPKFARLVYYIDKKRIGSGMRHSIEITVTDMVNNQSHYLATFWK